MPGPRQDAMKLRFQCVLTHWKSSFMPSGTRTISPVRDGTRGVPAFGTPLDRLLTLLSGRGDLNSRSPDPQSGALTKLGHVPPRHHRLPVAHTRRTSAGSASLAQPRPHPERSPPEPRRRAAVARMRDSRRTGKLRCAGHDAGAMLVELPTTACGRYRQEQAGTSASARHTEGRGSWDHSGLSAQPPPATAPGAAASRAGDRAGPRARPGRYGPGGGSGSRGRSRRSSSPSCWPSRPRSACSSR
jgi:hypothetical protein